MKNLLGFNTQSESVNIDGAGFIVKRISKDIAKRQEAIINKSNENINKACLPKWVSFINYILIVIGIMMTVSFFAFMKNEGFTKAFNESWYLLIFGILIILVYIGLNFFERMRLNKYKNSEEFKTVDDKALKVIADSMKALGISEDAPKVDLLQYPYHIKKDKVTNEAFYQYINCEYSMFVENDTLYFGDLSCLMAVQLNKIEGIYKVDKKVKMMGWNKDEPFSKGKYKDYMIREDIYGAIHVECYKMVIKTEKNEYELLFPVYELETITNLTNINPKTND